MVIGKKFLTDWKTIQNYDLYGLLNQTLFFFIEFWLSFYSSVNQKVGLNL